MMDIKVEAKVSIIIPFYKNRIWLEEALSSVFDQTYNCYEVILVNDGSPEFIDDIAALHNIIYIKTINKGPGHARNLGIEIASGDYIAFLDSDDIWMPTKLERQVKFMRETNAIWSHSDYFRFKDGERYDKDAYVNASTYHGWVYPKCLVRSHIATPCVMVKANFLKEHRNVRFSEKMRYGQDGFMWLHLSAQHELMSIPEALARIRMRGGNAVERARVHLKVRAELWDYLRNCKIEYLAIKSLNPFLKLVYKYCFLINKCLEYLFSQNKHTVTLEIVSKILYLPAFILFRIMGYRCFHSKG